jgi:tetratricopeptide (TPR) repeat protein
VRFNSGDYTGAEEALQANLRAWPGHADSYLALGYLYEQTGRVREAIAVYNAGRAAIPSDGRFAQRLRILQPPPE